MNPYPFVRKTPDLLSGQSFKNKPKIPIPISKPTPSMNGYFWKGANGQVYVQGDKGINSAGKWDGNSAKYWTEQGFVQTPDSPTSKVNGANTGGGGGGYRAPRKKIDTAQLTSLDSLINSLGSVKDQSIRKAAIKRDTSLREKSDERKNEEAKYSGKKLSTLQDFADAKTDTDLNTALTLENLVSSLSTLGLGGNRALTRQVLDAANISNRKANATQAKANRELDTSWNTYAAGNDNDVKKINDQYAYDEGEANRQYLQNKQNALYKKADVYNAVDDTRSRDNIMNEGNTLNNLIAGAAFMNPQYNGEVKAMATPDAADYTQDIANYTTALDLGDGAQTGQGGAGNLAMKAVALNDKDLGVKKRTESELGYGV